MCVPMGMHKAGHVALSCPVPAWLLLDLLDIDIRQWTQIEEEFRTGKDLYLSR